MSYCRIQKFNYENLEKHNQLVRDYKLYSIIEIKIDYKILLLIENLNQGEKKYRLIYHMR